MKKAFNIEDFPLNDGQNKTITIKTKKEIKKEIGSERFSLNSNGEHLANRRMWTELEYFFGNTVNDCSPMVYNNHVYAYRLPSGIIVDIPFIDEITYPLVSIEFMKTIQR